MSEEKQRKKYTQFESLFKTYHRRLYYFAYNIINDAEGAEDIVEDVFGYLWENGDALTPNDSPLLYSLVKSRCIDFLRHRDVEDRYQEACMAQVEWFEEEPEEVMDRDERIRVVRTAVAELSPQARKVIEACFLHGKKYKEVGEDMNISVNTVKTYIARALLFIRKRSGGLTE